MVKPKNKIDWQKPEIIFSIPFEKTAAGNPAGGDDYVTFGFSDSA